MPPCTSRRRRQNQDRMQGPTQGQSVGKTSTPRVRGGVGNEQFARAAQEIGRLERAKSNDPEKAYGIERLKKLGATVFEGSTDPVDAENWLNMLEKCFDVMKCPEDRKVRLATFLLQKEAEGWWKSILAMRSDARALDWQTFRGIFEDKYYPSTYCEAKRDEFLGLKQGSLSVAEYERKYTELSRYADVIVALKVTGAKVEIALRVEQNITEDKSTVELSHETSIASGFRGREQRRFTLGSPLPILSGEPHSRVVVRTDEGTSGGRQKGVVGRPRQHGKVYAMTQQEAEDAPDVITGMILICKVPADVLFDPGATHSFVSSIFLTKLNRMLEPLSDRLAIYTPVGDVLLVNEVLRCHTPSRTTCYLRPKDGVKPTNNIFLYLYLSTLLKTFHVMNLPI
ncbi:uncharacterized protein E5676_scaffold1301G00020 [Cucumis melo var. makuwa]|uniref:Retrotransposon gag domain-containing protein n=1 Tax=Cucumis melo var. makuwa TaxID=1194695 RepID=A0A5D3CK23_CUCMM|nr:uncharacterized protein E5676_scaffold1301G00020 [Cucumis melo var. makuwa]